MKLIDPQNIKPRIRHANYIDVDSGRFWGFRRMPDFELIYIVKGEFAYTNSNGCNKIESGQVLCIPPDEDHKFSAVGEKNIISCIHFDLLKERGVNKEVYTPYPYPELITNIENYDFFNQLFMEIANDFQKFTLNKYSIACQIFKTLWIKLSEYWESGEEINYSERMRAMMNYIKANIFNSVGRADLAKYFGYTPEYINCIFKKELSLTPTEFINREKIFTSFEMIKNREGNLREISEKLGFYDQYHFSKVFKKILGKPPSFYKSNS